MPPTGSHTLPSAHGARAQGESFRRFAWGVLGWNILVVLWGAYVRATGSGAGCGSHWPLCNGEVVPRAHSAELIVEFTHRLTSGLAALLVLGLVVWARRVFPAGHTARRWAWLSLIFMVVEALLGAGLVLFRLVEKDASLARGISMPLHLTNTLILLACLTATAWFAREAPYSPVAADKRSRMIMGAIWATMLVGITGAIAALGDTLFPATSFREGLRQELSTGAHILLRLRLLHPAVSLLAGVFILFTVAAVWKTNRFAKPVAVFVLVQLAAGGINVLLLAPVWMQLLHLLLADVLWVLLVLAYFSQRESAHAHHH